MRNLKLSRRGFLGGIAVTPVGAHILAEDIKLKMLNARLPDVRKMGTDVEAPRADGEQRFTSFARFFKAGGEVALRDDAKKVYSFDPDLVEMRSMSFQYKIIIQQKRNYKCLLVQKKNWFIRKVEKFGFFTVQDDDYY